VLGTLPAQAYRGVFEIEMAGLRVPPRESDTPAAKDEGRESRNTGKHRDALLRGI
jgi:hypothetical protein